MDSYINNLLEINRERQAELGRSPRAIVRTFGCQMNVRDSETLEAMIINMGFELINDENETDIELILLNTCAVRENAENRVYGRLGTIKRLKNKNPLLKIALCGCMAQQEHVADTIKRHYAFVDIVFGTFALQKFPKLLYTNLIENEQIIDIKNSQGAEGVLPQAHSHVFTHRHLAKKAFINITHGCDNFCAYCIVPYVRGREVCRPLEEILREARELAKDGVVEVCLLGQNVNSYGNDKNSGAARKGLAFASLLKSIAAVKGIERIRFMTSHPKDLSDELIDVIASEPKVCKHLHLPMQSGSTAVLTRMNRRYTKEQYIELALKIKSAVPGIALTTDIIVGFPGETDADFEHTLDVVRKVRFAGAFTFIYSKREGTPAASYEDQVPANVTRERFGKLLSVINPIIYEETRKRTGNTLRVLVDEKNGDMYKGRADNNALVHFTNTADCVGEFVDVKITQAKTFYLIGEAVKQG